MSVRLGISPLVWTNDNMPGLSGDTPLDICLSEGRRAGFTGFKLGSSFPRTPDALGPALNTHQLSLVSGWHRTSLLMRSAEEEIEALSPCLHMLKSLGTKVIVFCEVTGCVYDQRDTPLSHSPTMNEAEWTRFIARLSQVADYCQNQGIQVAYHCHLGTVIEKPAEIDRLMRETTSSVGLLLDTGHLAAAGGDSITLLKTYADRIRLVHCKDIRKEVLADVRNRDLSFLDSVLNGMFTVPGDGYIDYTAFFKELVASDYSGWLVMEAEQDPAIAPPFTYACLGYDNLRRFCAEAHLAIGAPTDI